MSVTGLKIAMMAMTKTVALVQVGVRSIYWYVRQQPLLFFLGAVFSYLEICIRIAVFLFIFLPLLYIYLCVVCVTSLTHATVCISSLGCNSYQYECDNGECISDDDVCDGTEDCYDGDDEDGCAGAGGRAKYCVASQFLQPLLFFWVY